MHAAGLTIFVYNQVSFLHYEGDSICNEIVPINQKVLYLYALQLHSQNDLLPGYTTAKSQLLQLISNIAQSVFKKGY